MNRKRCRFFFVFVVILTRVLVDGSKVTAQDAKTLAIAGKEIQSANSKIADAIIKNDIKVITETGSQVKSLLRTKEIAKENEIAATVITNWKQVRIGARAIKTDEPLTEKSWVAMFDRIEPCFIKSMPDQEAEIYIDGQHHSHTTNTVIGLRSDSIYKIRLKKGTKSAEGELKVEKGGKNTFVGELK